MKRYSNSVESPTTGLPLIGATVSVFLAGTTTLATIYAANDASSDPADNPFTSATGVFSFFVQDGVYDIRAVRGPLASIERGVEIFEQARTLRVANGDQGFTFPKASLLAGTGTRALGSNPDTGALQMLPIDFFKGNPGGNALAVGAAEAFGNLAIPVGTDAVITASARVGSSRGGARFRKSDDQAAPVAPFVRIRSSNGRFFDLDEQTPDLYQLGLKADLTDEADLLEAAFDYMSGQSERQGFPGKLIGPRGIFSYDRHIRFKRGGFTFEGNTQECRFNPRNNSRMIVGYIDPIRGEGPGNQSIKCYRPTFRNISIKPDQDHNGPLMVLEFADEVLLDHMDFGPYVMTGGTNPAFCVGLEVNWVQFLTVRSTIINTNGYCIQFVLDNRGVDHNENEDHYLIDSKCMLYIGKRPPNGSTPAIINVHHTNRRSRFGGIQNLEIKTAHFYQNVDGQGANDSRCVLWTTDFTDGRVRSLHNLRIVGGFWENMTYGLDSTSAMSGTVQSQMVAALEGVGNIQSGLNGGALIVGGGRDVAQVFVQGCSWTQVGQIARGALVTFGAGNRNYGVNSVYNGPLSDCRFVDKASGDVNGIGYLAGRRLATIGAGQTSVTFAHGLNGVGGGIIPNWVTASVIGGTPFPLAASISADTVTVTTSAPAPAGGIRVAVEVELLDS